MFISPAFYQSINLVNTLLSLLIAIFVLKKTYPLKTGMLFCLFAFLVSLWAFFFYLSSYVNDFYCAKFLFRTCMIAGALIPLIFSEFAFSFANKKIHPFYRWINWGTATIIILFIYTNYYAIDGGPFLGFTYWPIINYFSLLQIFQYILNIFFSHRALIQTFQIGNTLMKQQAKIIIIGTSIGYFGAATNFLLWFRIPFPPVLNILIPFYPISVAYAILKHRLMDINIVIKKGLVYSTIIAIFTALYISAIYILTRLFENILGLGSLGVAAVLIFAFALFFQPLKEKLNQGIDKLFFKSSYEYQTALKNLSQKVTMAANLDELNQLVSREIKNTLKVSAAEIQQFK